MNDRRTATVSIRAEQGGSLPPVLITIAVGAILLSPFLAHVSSRMLATRAAEGNAAEHYAADSGVEYAIWHLDNDAAYRSAVNAGTDSPLTLTVNGVSVTVDSTALPLGAWTDLADTLDTVGAGGSLAAGGDGLIYALRGNGTVQAWRYDPGSDVWSDFAVTDAPASVSAGGSLVQETGDKFYALRGGGSDFWGYESAVDSWDTSLGSFAGGVGDGGSMAYNGDTNRLYGFRGSNTNSFRRYRFAGGGPGPPPGWVGAPDAPDTVGSGGSLVTANGDLHAFRGGGSSAFWRFDPDDGPDGSWSTGGGDPSDAPAGVSSGGTLTWDGGDYIYALRGGGSDAFWRYSLSGDSWEVMASTPASVAAGGAITYGAGDTIYAMQGDQAAGFWKFEVTPPRYDVEAVAGDTTHVVRVELDGSTISIVFWDVQ